MGLRELLELLRTINTSEIPDVLDKYRRLAELFPVDFSSVDQIRELLSAVTDLLTEVADVTKTEADDAIIALIENIVPHLLMIIDLVAEVFQRLQEVFTEQKQRELGLTTEQMLSVIPD